MKKQWQRGTCAKCGKPGYLYEGTDLAWVHDKLEPPFHQFVLLENPHRPQAGKPYDAHADVEWMVEHGFISRSPTTTNYEPDENAVADERNDQVRVDEMPEDAVGYGEDWGRAASW